MYSLPLQKSIKVVLINCNMEVFENVQNKASDMHLMDFPLICRICLRRGDSRLFEEEDYLLDLFVTITKIDVCSKVEFPRNICNECISELEDISLFINTSKYNDARQVKNLIPKKELEFVAVDFGTSQDPVVKIEKTDEEDNICIEKSEMCRICLVSSCLTPFEEKAQLMQLFQNITNIDLEAASNSSSRNSICDECINKLEKISLFISLSLSSDMKLASAIGRIEYLKTEICLEENKIDFSSSKGNVIHFDITGRKEVKLENYSNESGSYESKDLYTVVDIKEEILDSPEASIRQNNQQRLEFYSDTNYVEKLGSSPCGNEVSTPVQHTLTHTGEKPFKCDSCGKSYNQKRILKTHMLTHTGKKPFKCDICQKGFILKVYLKKHTLTHSREKPFECDSCEKSFFQKQSLKTHMLTHTGEKPFKCDICQADFSQKGVLKTHMLTHSGEKPFECNYCNKSVSTKSNLQQHMLVHNRVKQFKCDSCEKGFNQKENLKAHMLFHAREKPFKCDVCRNGFSRKGVLKRHMLSHSGEKPFKCDVCQRAFSRKCRLKKHMLSHSGEKVVKCDVCQRGFSQKRYLIKHMLAHTEEKPFESEKS